MQKLLVTKRNGAAEPLDIDKIHRVLTWAAEGLQNVAVSAVELGSHIQFFDGIKTSDIHDVMIKAAADLISEDTPDYQYMAARLAMFQLRKKAHGNYLPPTLPIYIDGMVQRGLYDRDLLERFSADELQALSDFIDHERDLRFTYAAVKQWEGKYLIQNRVTGAIYETPQFAYMAMAMSFFQNYVKETRLHYIKRFYDAIALFKISLPTPIMGGLRTPTRQFSSCVKIEVGDSLDSINAAASAVVKYVSQRAGIGLNIGRVRALGSTIRGGEALHTGVTPFLKLMQAAVKSCSQGGIRGGAATVFYPVWHLEVESLIVLKNNRGVEENRVRHMDYAVQLNKLMYERLLSGGNITLFSPNDVDGLYEAFFVDQPKFELLYQAAEKDPAIRKKTLKAVDLFSVIMQERAQTGRIYIQNVDHCNTHSAFHEPVAPVRQSNLCMEIALPTDQLENVASPEGEVALCTLAAVNLGAIDNDADMEDATDLIVRALDELLDYQDYPVAAAEKAKDRRALGVGITNYAYYLAKNGVRYSDGSANNLTHRLMESFQYYLLKASTNLASEKGACGLFFDTKYARGILPIDTYKRNELVGHTQPLLEDWESLRRSILTYGLRNSTVSALMPCETSSQITNSTNGIEPPRGLVSVKQSKDGTLRQVVPAIGEVQYELLWDMPNNSGYLELVGIMQKFVDQSISANTNYDPTRFTGGKVPMRVLLQDLLLAYRLGIKTLYYHNTRDGAGDDSHSIGCAGGACTV